MQLLMWTCLTQKYIMIIVCYLIKSLTINGYKSYRYIYAPIDPATYYSNGNRNKTVIRGKRAREVAIHLAFESIRVQRRIYAS